MGFMDVQNLDDTQLSGAVAGTKTAAALSATYGPFRDQSQVGTSPMGLKSLGMVLGLGAAGAFDAGKVESPSVFLDQATGQLKMIYTGYTNTTATGVASHGIASSNNGITWTKGGQFFAASGVAGASDQYGVTGPVVFYDNGIYHLFYIGLNALGYEGGTPTICHAYATSLTGPWTRDGTVIGNYGTGWRSAKTWHPNIVRNKGKWYLFFNATGSTNKERCGYATATSLFGPWTIDDTNSPILPESGHTTDNIWGGDPFVYREDDHWRMEFSRADLNWNPDGDWFATTTDANFPLGWVIGSKTLDASVAFKPWITRYNGQIFHYGSAPTGIGLAIGQDATNQNRTVDMQWKFNAPRGTAQDSTLIVGDDIRSATQNPPATKFNVGNAGAASEVVVGQDSSHSVLFSWAYDPTAANATGKLETYGGSNPLNIQNNAGPLMLGGTTGKLGFYGTAPVAKPALTYSRATETAASTQLRTTLVALGLVTDSTVA